MFTPILMVKAMAESSQRGLEPIRHRRQAGKELNDVLREVRPE
jgi:hypothetical protein